MFISSLVVAGMLMLAAPPESVGPGIGAVTDSTASVWVRLPLGKKAICRLVDQSGPGGSGTLTPPDVEKLIEDENDRVVQFDFSGLIPMHAYSFEIRPDEGEAVQGQFQTLVRTGNPSKVSIAFGSCANDKADVENPSWRAILQVQPDVLCLIGDTPYIDSTKLDVQRERYRTFFSGAGLREVIATIPTIGLWDDHDFGQDGADGRLEGKENSLKAFNEYHANPARSDAEGVYTSFRAGDAEVFLLDARWFANSETRELLGEKQWKWLEDGLTASTASFKLLTCGMIWNDSVRPLKTDYIGHYPNERKRLFEFIENHKIGGVVLVGGDIHRSRALKHERAATGVSYPLYEVVTSPLGTNVHATANVAHKGLVFDAGEPHSFCVMTVDSLDTQNSKLTIRWQNAAGKELFVLPLEASQLQVQRGNK